MARKCILSPFAFFSSTLQQSACDLRVHYLSEATSALHEITQLNRVITFNSNEQNSDNSAACLVFPDASQGKSFYGQSGHFFGIFCQVSKCYILSIGTALKRVGPRLSSIGADIFAAS